MTFVEAVNILQKRFGDELSNERRMMKKYVKNHPEDRIIAEAFEVYIKVVRMPKKGEKRINGMKNLTGAREKTDISNFGICMIHKQIAAINLILHKKLLIL